MALLFHRFMFHKWVVAVMIDGTSESDEF